MIPVHRPKLPPFELISRYLKEIDEARWYSNFGPLLGQFEARLAAHFGVTNNMLASAANGTLMLVAILKAWNIPQNSLCIMPSWTFVATAAAAHYAGLVPYFVDVNHIDQTLDPVVLKRQLASLDEPVGAVIVIAPFGAPVDREAWDIFTSETGIPVIIDAAAAFDTVGINSLMKPGKSPMMISLHATKVFGIGEGGIVLSTDKELVSRIRRVTSFGFNGNREAISLGFNAKLSEYSAAVGLASLDLWDEMRKQWAKVRDHYMHHLDAMQIAHCFSSEWISSTCNVILPEKSKIVAEQLKMQGIDTRQWWSDGCHQHPAYKGFPRSRNLDETEWLSQSVLGLPFAIDLEPKQIDQICNILKRTIDALTKNNAA